MGGTRGAHKNHTIKFLQKLTENRFSSENTCTNELEEYCEEEIIYDLHDKEQRQADKFCKMVDRAEKKKTGRFNPLFASRVNNKKRERREAREFKRYNDFAEAIPF